MHNLKKLNYQTYECFNLLPVTFESKINQERETQSENHKQKHTNNKKEKIFRPHVEKETQSTTQNQKGLHRSKNHKHKILA